MKKAILKRVVAAATLVGLTVGAVLLPSPAQAKDTDWPVGIMRTSNH